MRAFMQRIGLSILVASCGNQDPNAAGTNPNNNPGNNPGLTEGPGKNGQKGTNFECENSWTSFVKNHPVGLSLTYEIKDNFSVNKSKYIVTEASAASVKVTHAAHQRTETITTLKDDHIQKCLQGTLEVITGNVLAMRKESKRTKSGTFSTNYMKLSNNYQISDSLNWYSTNEMWTQDNALSTLIYQKVSTTMEGQTTETTTELIEMTQ
jgi:hypothetical protein